MKHYPGRILLFAAILFACSASNLGAEAPGNPRSAKECAICHYRWIDTFFVEGKGSDLASYQPKKVVATPDMCFSCHDGSVLDSRKRLSRGAGHKTNTPPSPHMDIPKIYPLDEKGNVQCATCHTPHGVPSGPGAKESIFLRTSNKRSAMCRACHKEADGGLETGNHPVGNMKSPVSEMLVSLGSVAGESGRLIICETCHSSHGSVNESLLIKSGKDSGICLACHGEKRNTVVNGKKKPFHLVNISPRNVVFPKSLLQRGAKTGPRSEIICQTCHKVHDNKGQQSLLVVGQGVDSELCITCHTNKKYVQETKHNLAHSAPAEKNLQGNLVSEKGVCSACHLPHREARKFAGRPGTATGLCLSCHGEGKFSENHRLNAHSHPLDVKPRSKKQDRFLSHLSGKGNSPSLPLFNAFGLPDRNGGVACATCHDPHRWRRDTTRGEVRKEMKGDRWTSFLREASPDLCRGCHLEKFVVAGSKHDLNKTAPDASNAFAQTPSQAGLCGSCHVIHGGATEFLWARKSGPGGGASPAQALCASCHNERGIAREKVLKGYSHPLGVSPIEKGMGTTLPLFDKADKQIPDGVVRCHTCHDTHGSPAVVAYGGRQGSGEGTNHQFLRLTYLPSPSLCEDCHTHKGNIEMTDHDLTMTAPESKNMLGNVPLKSGVCGACHAVHGSKNKTRLWARSLGTGNSVMEMMCNSCHSQTSSVKATIPRIASHPEGVLVTNLGKRRQEKIGGLPLFDGRSGESVKVGNISCPSCHDAHVWEINASFQGAGGNVEGNATNSFLRARARDLPCKNCHGTDSLFKYLYFHEPGKREKLRVFSYAPKGP